MAKKVKDAIEKGAKRAKDATDRTAKAAQDAADQIEGVGEKLRKSRDKLAKQGSSVSLKVIEQAEANTREAFAAMRAAASAKTPAEVAKIQGEYLRDQGARSLAHAREIGELIMQFGRDAAGGEKKG